MRTHRARDRPDLIREVSSYDTLEQADREAGGLHDEEWLINLQNHLIWGSYTPDAESAPVVCAAIRAAAASLGLRIGDLPAWTAELLARYSLPPMR